jgi:hypothetical protein
LLMRVDFCFCFEILIKITFNVFQEADAKNDDLSTQSYFYCFLNENKSDIFVVFQVHEKLKVF